MPHKTTDPLTGDPVFVAPERRQRPNAFDLRAHDDSPESCPFCPGRESQTPPELARVQDGAGWLLRVVPNRYPFVGGAVAGAHEVIIESPSHHQRFEDAPAAHAAAIVNLWRDRFRHHDRDGVAYSTLFKNRGRRAGQSLRHPHSQFVALSEVPDRIAQMAAAFAASRRCPICSAVEDEAVAVWRGERFRAFVPRGARHPFEIWIAPVPHQVSIVSMSDDDAGELASALQQLFRNVARLLGDPDSNTIIVNPPRRAESFHWHVAMIPRLAAYGGFELGTGIAVNLVEPEEAARELRSASVASR